MRQGYVHHCGVCNDTGYTRTYMTLPIGWHEAMRVFKRGTVILCRLCSPRWR